MRHNKHAGTVRRLFAMLAGVFLATPALAEVEVRTEVFTAPDGEEISYEYHIPNDFDSAKTYPVAIGGAYYWRGAESTKGWILVQASPRSDNNDLMEKILNHLAEKYNVEGGRFHMVCYSACGGPAFTVAAAFPDRFASVTALTGAPRNARILNAVKHMKIRLIVGENDGGWRRGAEKAYKDFQAAGADVTLELIPGAGHVIAEIAGAPFMERMEKLRE